MKKIFKYFFSNNILLNRYSKRIVVILADATLCIICTWFAFVLRLEQFISFSEFNFYPAIISILIAVPIFWLFGLYRTIFRYTGTSIILTILSSTFVFELIFFRSMEFKVLNYLGLNKSRSIGVIQPMFFAVVLLRLLAKYILTSKINFKTIHTLQF